jgi:hypothetical protein
MPAKHIKTASGRVVAVKSIRLANGNLLVPRRDRATNRAVWAEVKPGEPEYKRWLPVAVDEADPR